jgi:hypothetical protein
MRFHPANLLNVKAKGMAITAVINIILAIVPIPKSKRYAMAHQESWSITNSAAAAEPAQTVHDADDKWPRNVVHPTPGNMSSRNVFADTL